MTKQIIFQELPLSFGELASLKWLDLKGNPLELELSQAAGDCLDEKGCKMAALNVVQLMHDRSVRQQRLLEKQKSVKKRMSIFLLEMSALLILAYRHKSNPKFERLLIELFLSF